jgi:hypothetical protein
VYVRLCRFAAFLLICAAAPRAHAVELRLRFGALERMLGEQLFTEEGKRHLGSKRTKCNFAYLQKPRIHSDGGRLRITAQFTGRTSLDVFGRCVGLGDEFDLIISARPEYRNEGIGFADVKVQGAKKNSFYIRRVCAAMSASLARDFKYPLAAEARRILEDTSTTPAYPRELGKFKVNGIVVTDEELVLDLNFALTIK